MRRLALAVTLVAAATLVSSTSAMAQTAKKKQRQRISPHETITETIDGNELKLVYGRPYSKKPGTTGSPQDLGGAGPLRQGLAHGRRRGDAADDRAADRDRRHIARCGHVLAVHRPRRGRHRQARHQQEDRPVGHSVQRGVREGQRAGAGGPEEGGLSIRRSTSSRWRSIPRPAAAA